MDGASTGIGPSLDGALLVSASGASWAVPAGLVRRVDSAASPALLPLAPAEVEGVVPVQGRPVVQIDLARAAGGVPGSGRNCLVLAVPGGSLALRVEAVRRALPAEARSLPRLPVEQIAPWAFDAGRDGARAGDSAPAGAHRIETGTGLAVLRFAAGGHEAAVPVEEVEAVAQVSGVYPLRRPGQGETLVAAVDGAVLPARSLAALFGGTAGGERWCILGRSAGRRMALLVDAVRSIDRLPPARVGRWIAGDGRPVACIVEGGSALPLATLAELLGGGRDAAPAPVATIGGGMAEGRRLALPGTEVPETGAAAGAGARGRGLAGVRLALGTGAIVVPLQALAGVFSRHEVAPVGRRRGGSGRPPAGAVPVIDPRRWVEGVPPAGDLRFFVAVAAAGGGALIGAPRLSADPAAAAGLWHPMPPAPPGPASLFDALARDAGETSWLFRLRAAPEWRGEWRSLPRPVRRRMLGAVIGWVPAPSREAAGAFRPATSRDGAAAVPVSMDR